MCKFTNSIKLTNANKVVITDMDGTLYRLNSPGNTYSGSTLETAVLANARKFLVTRNFATEETVEQIMRSGLSDLVGLSANVQKNFGVSRGEYFDNVWNIDPEGMLQDFEEAVTTLQALVARGSKIILLTSGAKAWQEQVCNYLGITKLFDTIYTGEDFGTKDEIFAKLSQQYSPTDMISVGDQYKTDIEPAQKYGISTLWVKEPKDITKLFEV